MNKPAKNHLFLLLLLVPIFFFYAGYFLNHPPEYKPTGFIQYDNISYVAHAKQYLDHPGTGLFFSNPFNESGNYPKIYFQTQTIILTGLLKFGVDPGLAISIFSIIFCFLAIWVAIALYDHLYPDQKDHRIKILVLFIWGGGIIALTGILLRPFMSTPLDLGGAITYFDPAGGWWGLNLGRSLFFGTESYYHFLFFATLLLLVKRKWPAAVFISFILSISHPFTGIHLLLLLLAWTTTEKIYFKNKTIPWWLPFSVLLLVAIHLYYYLIYLPSFPDHKSVSDQSSLNWNYRTYRSLPAFIPAYIIVFCLFIWSIRLQSVKTFMANSNNRLLICLALVSLLLCNHDLFMKPMQPIHFTRGYEWVAYFLLGVPAIRVMINYFQVLPKRRWLLYVFMFLFLSDNFSWIIKNVVNKSNIKTHLSKDQQAIINIIQTKTDNNTLVLGSDPELMPYVTVYTPSYPWYSHIFATPFFEKKKAAYSDFIKYGTFDQAWVGRYLIFIFSKRDSAELNRSNNISPGKVLGETENYRVISTNTSISITN